MGFGGSYGHVLKLVKISELVKFDGIVVRSGVRGGSGGAMYRRWIPDCADYNDLSAQSMTHRRFLQIKIVVKLCNNLIPREGNLVAIQHTSMI
jgi:hypothetical protein